MYVYIHVYIHVYIYTCMNLSLVILLQHTPQPNSQQFSSSSLTPPQPAPPSTLSSSFHFHSISTPIVSCFCGNSIRRILRRQSWLVNLWYLSHISLVVSDSIRARYTTSYPSDITSTPAESTSSQAKLSSNDNGRGERWSGVNNPMGWLERSGGKVDDASHHSSMLSIWCRCTTQSTVLHPKYQFDIKIYVFEELRSIGATSIENR